ncbi:MAG: hypothetical protein WAK36_17065, partial [Pseudolabrys sp.]
IQKDVACSAAAEEAKWGAGEGRRYQRAETILASPSLEPSAEAAITMALSAGISPSMEATRRDCRCPLLGT